MSQGRWAVFLVDRRHLGGQVRVVSRRPAGPRQVYTTLRLDQMRLFPSREAAEAFRARLPADHRYRPLVVPFDAQEPMRLEEKTT